jgi:hypothetical protein
MIMACCHSSGYPKARCSSNLSSFLCAEAESRLSLEMAAVGNNGLANANDSVFIPMVSSLALSSEPLCLTHSI